jgi:DNA-directed RNA polymerase subunit K/omega
MEKDKITNANDKQVFDDLGVNPYEVVIAVSRMARTINDKAQKYLGHGCDINPIDVAMKRIQSRRVHFEYDKEKEKQS